MEFSRQEYWNWDFVLINLKGSEQQRQVLWDLKFAQLEGLSLRKKYMVSWVMEGVRSSGMSVSCTSFAGNGLRCAER